VDLAVAPGEFERWCWFPDFEQTPTFEESEIATTIINPPSDIGTEQDHLNGRKSVL